MPGNRLTCLQKSSMMTYRFSDARETRLKNRNTSVQSVGHTQSFGWLCLTVFVVALELAGCNQHEPSDENRRPAASTASSDDLQTDEVLPQEVFASSASIFTDADTPYTARQGDNLCYGFDGTQERRIVPEVAKPPYLTYYRDPTFGAKVIRITDGQLGEVNKPAYSTMQAWNADESLMILYRTGSVGSGHYLHNGTTYERIRQLDIGPSDLEDVFWSYTDPSSFYYISTDDDSLGHFLKHNVHSGEETLLLDTTQVCSAGERATAGYDVQMHSHDDDTFGFRCLNTSTESSSLAFTFQQSTGAVKRTVVGQGTGIDAYSAPMVTPSGDRFLIPPVLLSEELKNTGFKIDRAQTEHASIGKAWNGQDAFFSTTFKAAPRGCDDEMWQGVSHLVEFNLEAGSCRTVLNQSDGWPPTTSGTHVSATAYKRPGWVAVSSIGNKDLHYLRMESLENRSAPVFFSEIFLVNTNPNEPAVCRLAQHRSYGKSAQKGGYAPYFSEPHATLSPSATRILFGSDWYDSGTVDAYVIELPAYSPARVQ